MHRGKSACLGVSQQHRYAVGGFDGEQNLSSVADQRVAVNVIAQDAGFCLRFQLVMNDADVGAVYLPTSGQCPVALEEVEKTPAGFLENFPGLVLKAGH